MIKGHWPLVQYIKVKSTNFFLFYALSETFKVINTGFIQLAQKMADRICTEMNSISKVCASRLT